MDKVDLKTMYHLPWSLYPSLDISLIITMTCEAMMQIYSVNMYINIKPHTNQKLK